MLKTTDHDRGSAGLNYVYPVVSRRAGGVSIGININTNNACNWQCMYCQVPELKRGAAPAIDLQVLQDELHLMLTKLDDGRFFKEFDVATEYQVLKDIAISGNGEPTTSKDFEAVIDVIGAEMQSFGLINKINVVLITNGSQLDKLNIQQGITKLAALGGEVWFKVDSATESGIQLINGARFSLEKMQERMHISLGLCPTWIQHFCVAIDCLPPSEQEQQAFLNFINAFAKSPNLRGVLLYGFARPSLQIEAHRLSQLPIVFFDQLAERVGELGVSVKVTP